jgi:hypothetical protein
VSGIKEQQRTLMSPESTNPEEPDWLPHVRKRVMNIIESEFEDCYPERVIAADFEAEYDRIWDILKKEADERLIKKSPNLLSGEPVRITLPEVINQILDEMESRQFRF